MSYPPSDLDTDRRMEEEGLWRLQRAPNKVRAEGEASGVIEGRGCQTAPQTSGRGSMGPVSSPSLLIASVIIMIRASLLRTHTVPNISLSTLHRLRGCIPTRAPRGGCYHKSLFKEKGTKAQRG